jgi:hypothetical protein
MDGVYSILRLLIQIQTNQPLKMPDKKKWLILNSNSDLFFVGAFFWGGGVFYFFETVTLIESALNKVDGTVFLITESA